MKSVGFMQKAPVFSGFPFTNSNFILNISLSVNQIHEGNKTDI